MASGYAAASSAGYIHDGRPGVYAAGFMVAAVAAAAVVVMLAAMLGHRETRSLFVRLMLIICVITGRKSRDYLPPVSGGQIGPCGRDAQRVGLQAGPGRASAASTRLAK